VSGRVMMAAAGVDVSLVKVVGDKFTASFFCSTDDANNQIASFYTGAMANAGELSFRTLDDAADTLAIISPNDPEAMVQYAEECSTMGLRYIWDPGQQCARMDGVQLADGIDGAAIVICNDYEFELIRQKTGLSEADVLARAGVPPDRIVDPTGVGDAFRGGLMKGLAQARPLAVAAQMGSVAAAFALEHLGGQSHAYTWPEFVARYERHYGPLD
jgi:adenosine kinase